MGMNINLDQVKKLLSYNPETGEFTWLVNRTNGVKAGDLAGSSTSSGYIRICLFNKEVLGHRLAWFFMTGVFPNESIDHINMIRSDNRWVNLREASAAQNAINSKKHEKTSSKFKGVTWHNRDKKWQASIGVNSRMKYLGSFVSEEDAAIAYDLAAKELYKDFAKLNFIEVA